MPFNSLTSTLYNRPFLLQCVVILDDIYRWIAMYHMGLHHLHITVTSNMGCWSVEDSILAKQRSMHVAS